ncbi:Smr/MutS family protein [Myxococcota bacterium]|nr:Smr/MutS family protein [Myxococcota bacterium]
MGTDDHDSDSFGDEAPIVVVPIEESIDLHGFRPREILDVVDAYLDAALEEGFAEVRLIHGRGKGVQRARVREWLKADPRVSRVEEAPPQRGGWGATLAWLVPARVTSDQRDPET